MHTWLRGYLGFQAYGRSLCLGGGKGGIVELNAIKILLEKNKKINVTYWDYKDNYVDFENYIKSNTPSEKHELITFKSIIGSVFDQKLWDEFNQDIDICLIPNLLHFYFSNDADSEFYGKEKNERLFKNLKNKKTKKIYLCGLNQLSIQKEYENNEFIFNSDQFTRLYINIELIKRSIKDIFFIKESLLHQDKIYHYHNFILFDIPYFFNISKEENKQLSYDYLFDKIFENNKELKDFYLKKMLNRKDEEMINQYFAGLIIEQI